MPAETVPADPRHDFILASTSPRRIELLQTAGFAFRSIAPDIEESSSAHLTARELTLLNARRKTLAVAAFHPETLVLGADTVVEVDHQILGKPVDLPDARRMLRLLADREHDVLTSFCLAQLQIPSVITCTVVSRVIFRQMSDLQIDDYLTRIDPLDKAGAYAAQEHAELIIERIEGSTSNVIGLPMEALALAFRSIG